MSVATLSGKKVPYPMGGHRPDLGANATREMHIVTGHMPCGFVEEAMC